MHSHLYESVKPFSKKVDSLAEDGERHRSIIFCLGAKSVRFHGNGLRDQSADRASLRHSEISRAARRGKDLNDRTGRFCYVQNDLFYFEFLRFVVVLCVLCHRDKASAEII